MGTEVRAGHHEAVIEEERHLAQRHFSCTSGMSPLPARISASRSALPECRQALAPDVHAEAVAP